MALTAAFVVPHPPLIIPAVGRGEERKIQATVDAFDEVARQIAELAPDTIIVTSPHATLYADYFHISPGSSAHGDMERFCARNSTLTCSYDTKLASCIAQIAGDEDFFAGTDYERDQSIDHATYIPLYFVNKYYQDYRVVRIGLSGLGPVEHYHMGQIINEAVERTGRNAVLIASGDLSHKLTEDGPYGYSPEGPLFDKQITEALATGDFLKLLEFEEAFCDKAAECGLRSFQIMAGALDRKKLACELLSYEGPFGVGYAVASFHVLGDDVSRSIADTYLQGVRATIEHTQNSDPFVKLARESVNHFVRTGKPLPMPDNLPDELTGHTAGVFVSIHEHGRLRGCIGTITARADSIAEEIIYNGISACSEDPRFPPVRIDELDQLEISVDVLGQPESIDSSTLLDPQHYGVIVSSGYKRGLLLPMLDGVDTVEEQISIAKHKAGIADHEPCTLQRFEVVRHEAGLDPVHSNTKK